MFRKTLRGASYLSASEIVNQACSVTRNIILARFLAKADFGVAALLGMILTLFEMASKMALGQQVVQSKRSDDTTFISSVHFTQLSLGLLSATLILGCTWPLAHFFAGPQYVLSIAALALIPLLNGFANLDPYYQTRQMVFGPLVLSDTLPNLLTTLAAWPLAAWFRDYRAVVWILLARAFLSTLLTHVLSKRSYSARFDPPTFRESLKFGWPLLAAGFIRFGNFQGDSMVVASGYTLSQLGEFSVSTTIAMTPGFALLRIANVVSLPLLSEVQSDRIRLSVRFRGYVEMMVLLSCAATLGLLFCGEQLVTLMFGQKYAGVGILACWLMAAQGLRIIRGATSGAAMARGDTVNSMMANAWRLVGLGFAILVGLYKANLIWFAAAGCAGEIVAMWSSVKRLSSKHGIDARNTLVPTGIGAACLAVAIATKVVLGLAPQSAVNWCLLAISLLVTTGVFLASCSVLRGVVQAVAFKLNSKLGAPLPVSWWAAEMPARPRD